MGSTMFQLRSFVHQRLYAAGEEILGEVEKTITLALYEAEVSRSKEEVESLRHQLGLLRKKQAEEPSLTSSTVDCEDKYDTPLPQQNPEPSEPSAPDDCNFSLCPEAPGPSQASADLNNGNWNYSLDEMDFKMSVVKEEQEECGYDSQMQEFVFPSSKIVKCEKDQPENQVSFKLHPVYLDSSEAQIENNHSDEEFVNSKGEQTDSIKGKVEAQSGSIEKSLPYRLPYDSQSGKNEKGRSFCHLCGKGFQYIGSLMKHIKAHENKNDCTICGVTCQSTEELISHLKNRHNKTYFCDICGQTFANEHCVRLHERIHAGIRDFVCQECGKTFHRREHLIVHVRTHSGEKPYHCDICGKAFSQSQNLTIHKRSHSGERPYHCDLCGKLFNTSSHLKTHMRYHSGEKPYPCDICGKRFRQSGQMTRHRTTHTGERPYACHVCGMRYRFAPNLKVHLQTHEQEAAE
ncbi:zinc finger protein 287-like [Notolabrus celidotus]|uniref:zinc finger protein 287-like n=1 Tax=Notolabrus celidotus TaxID=1203425 RepID=UPI0014906FF6|nr:zinc finger protein 287-like [Notolabrus celidotus]